MTALEPLLRKWRAFDKWLLQEVAVKPVFAWFDLWIGFFVDRDKRRLYVLPLPCVGFYIQFTADQVPCWCNKCGFVGWVKPRRRGPAGFLGHPGCNYSALSLAAVEAAKETT
jgi:hypothetical protein